MERRSDKHAPRVDDDLSHGTESLVRGAPVEARAEESREQEGPADAEPVPDSRIDSEGGEPAEERAELARHIPRAAFPGTRDAVLSATRSVGAPDAILRRLEELPERRYASVQEVWQELSTSGQ